jgi:[ribosomal protein S18]-alanine N-acetyltransferase
MQTICSLADSANTANTANSAIPANMKFRLYRDNDFNALYDIELACFEPPFRFSRAMMRKLIADPASATLIAEEDEKMAGFGIIYWSHPPEQPLAYIQTLEVAPTHRNRGVARELLRRMEQSATAAGAHVIWLHVAESNAPAIRLYESHGFSQQGREPNFYAKGIPALLLAKPIG